MPIHDLGYRRWQGQLTPHVSRWWVIAQTGIRLAWRSQWLRRMLFIAWLPAVYLGVGFFAYEQGLKSPGGDRYIVAVLREIPESDEVIRRFMTDPAGARHHVWALLLLTFFRYPQGVLMVLVVGVIAPALISADMRSRAFLLYFSRPIQRTEYMLGKAAILWFYLSMITTVPALALYTLGVLLSPDLSVIDNTWDLPLRVVAASVVLMVPTTALALCFSSLTTESRYAGFAWFAVWALGWVAYANLSIIDAASYRTTNRWTLVSLYHTLGRVQSWVFGLHAETKSLEVWTAAALLMMITLISVVILSRRVASPTRI